MCPLHGCESRRLCEWVVFALCYVLCAVIFLTESAAPVRGFLVVTAVRGEGGPVPALLYARTATWYRVLGRSPDTLAVGSRPAVLTRSAAASLSCCRQYRICWRTMTHRYRPFTRLSSAYTFILFLKRPWVSSKVLLLLLMLSYKLHVNSTQSLHFQTHMLSTAHDKVWNNTRFYMIQSHQTAVIFYYFLHISVPAVFKLVVWYKLMIHGCTLWMSIHSLMSTHTVSMHALCYCSSYLCAINMSGYLASFPLTFSWSVIFWTLFTETFSLLWSFRPCVSHTHSYHLRDQLFVTARYVFSVVHIFVIVTGYAALQGWSHWVRHLVSSQDAIGAELLHRLPGNLDLKGGQCRGIDAGRSHGWLCEESARV